MPPSPFTPLTLPELAHLTAWTTRSRSALLHSLRAERGLAEAEILGKELGHMQALPGFDRLDAATRAYLSAPFVHHQSVALSQWQEHSAAEGRALREAAAHRAALGF